MSSTNPPRTLTLPVPSEPGSDAAVDGVFRFGPFELQAKERRLLVDGKLSALRGRALDLLLALTEQPGQLVSRDALLDRVWGRRVVEENNLSVQINALRRVLGHQIIATVPGYGYRFDWPPAAPAGTRQPLQLVPRSEAAPAPTLRTNLPQVLAPLVGREGDAQALSELIDRHRLVTLLGSPGIGKTSLAQAVLQARSGGYRHGVCFVALADLDRAEALPAYVAAAAGLRLNNAGASNDPAALAAALAGFDLLLVLDNAEHLIEPVALMCRQLLDQAPGARLLVTSQAPLRLPEEQRFQLGALGLPTLPCSAEQALVSGAVALFVQRAQAHDRHFRLNDADVDTVVTLCRLLDAAPLAIGLAAARASLLGLPALLAAMDQRLRLLSGGPRDAAPRHRSLRAALGWAHELLSPLEQRVFRRLAVFEGSVSLALAQQVLPDRDNTEGSDDAAESEVLDAIGGLIERSLLERAGSADRPRFRLLESSRALALESLAQAAEAAAWRARHARAVIAQWLAADAALWRDGLHFEAWQAALAPDAGNARAALAWACEHAPADALSLMAVISLATPDPERALIEPLFARPLALADDPALNLPAAARGRLLHEYAVHAFTQHRQTGMDGARRALLLCAEAGDLLRHFLAAARVAWMAGGLGDRATYESALATQRRLHRPDWPALVQANGLLGESWQPVFDKDFDAALALKHRQLAVHREAGLGVHSVRVHLGSLLLGAGRADEAIEAMQSLVAEVGPTRDNWVLLFALGQLTSALLTQSRAAEARDCLVRFWPLAQQYRMQALWVDDAALLAALEGRPRAAWLLAGYADAAFARQRNQRTPADLVANARAMQLAQQAHEAQTAGAGPQAGDLAAELKARGAGLSEAEMRALALDEV